VEVKTLTPGRILRNLAGHLPFVIFSGFLTGIFIAAGLSFLLGQWMNEETAQSTAVAAAALLVLVGLPVYVRYVGNRFARCRLQLIGDVLVVKGETSRGQVERVFELRHVERIVFGESLNWMERALDSVDQWGLPKSHAIRMTKDLKAGRLLVRDTRSGDTVFHHVNKVFEAKSLLRLARELDRRGVVVERAP
jgi:hypothetical protein